MYTSLRKMANVVAPLQDLLEEVLGGGKRTKGVANNKPRKSSGSSSSRSHGTLH